MVENTNAIDGGSKMIPSSSSSTAHISALSDELLIEIVCKLDCPKYATQCKCICKRWFSLIDTNTSPSSNSYFLRRWKQIHLREEKEQPMALLTQYLYEYELGVGSQNYHAIDHCFNSSNESPIFKALTFLPRSSTNYVTTNGATINKVYIVATFKDMVLCCARMFDHSVYYICNLFTGQWTALPWRPPPPPPYSRPHSRVPVGLIVSEDGDHGYKFKVFRVVTLDAKGITASVEIFSSDTGEWRQNVVSFEGENMIRPDDGTWYPILIPYNGMMVWLGVAREEIVGIKLDDPSSIVNLSIPRNDGENLWVGLLGLCQGRLRVAQLVVDPPLHEDINSKHELKLFIWQHNSDGECWELVHELDFSEIEDSRDSCIAKSCYENGNTLSRSGITSVLAFHPYDEDKLFLFFGVSDELARETHQVSSCIFLCNLRKRTLELIRELPVWYTRCIGFSLVQPCWPTQ